MCTVALLAAGVAGGAGATGGGEATVLASRSVIAGRGHTRLLLGLCDEVLSRAEAGPADLQAIVVGTGPGTFTGVRIGVAAARAMALSLDIPVWGVPTLDALAAAAAEAAAASGSGDRGDEVMLAGASILMPVGDARRGQFFAVLYQRTPSQQGDPGDVWTRTGDFFAADPADLAARAAGAGEGLCAEGEGSTVALGDATLLARLPMPGLPMAVEAAFLVRGRSRLVLPPVSGEQGSPESVRPLYVRRPDADVHITRMKDPWAS